MSAHDPANPLHTRRHPPAAAGTVLASRPQPDTTSAPTAGDASSASASPLPLAAGRPGAGEQLRNIVLSLGLQPLPLDTQTGTYTVIRLTQWLGHVRIGAGTGTAVATSTRWRNEHDDSGRIVSTRWHPLSTGRSDTPVEPPVTRSESFAARGLPGVKPGRIPKWVPALTAALDNARLPPPEQAILDLRHRVLAAGERRRASVTRCPVRAAGDLARWHDTPLPVRTSILLALAHLPDLLTHGPLTLAGRRALAVSVTTGPIRQILGIDPVSGEIHLAERVLLDEAIGRRLGVTTPYLLERHVITDRGRSTHTR